MSFVQQIEHDPVCRGIVTAVGAMADALGLRLVAEGVETATQRQALDEMGVAFGQGSSGACRRRAPGTPTPP